MTYDYRCKIIIVSKHRLKTMICYYFSNTLYYDKNTEHFSCITMHRI